MVNKSLESEILYVPDRRKGDFIFDGVPCATNDTYEIIGEEGIEFICDRIRNMIDVRMQMFGNAKREFYGFASNQHFVHLPSKSIIRVSGNQQPYSYHKGDFKHPERFNENHFVIDTNPSDRFSKRYFQREVPKGYFIHGGFGETTEYLTKDPNNPENK